MMLPYKSPPRAVAAHLRAAIERRERRFRFRHQAKKDAFFAKVANLALNNYKIFLRGFFRSLEWEARLVALFFFSVKRDRRNFEIRQMWDS